MGEKKRHMTQGEQSVSLRIYAQTDFEFDSTGEKTIGILGLKRFHIGEDLEWVIQRTVSFSCFFLHINTLFMIICVVDISENSWKSRSWERSAHAAPHWKHTNCKILLCHMHYMRHESAGGFHIHIWRLQSQFHLEPQVSLIEGWSELHFL